MHVETLRGRVAAIVARAEAARDDAAITEVRAEFAAVDRDVKAWAEDRMAAAREDGRTTLHADDARKAQQLRALVGDAAMAVGDMMAADGEAKANRARLAGGSNRPAGRGDNGSIESREWKSIVPTMREFKAQSIGTDPQGGFLVDAQAGPFFDRLRADAVILAAGPRIEQVTGADALDVPVLKTSTTALLSSELGTMTESNATFGKGRVSIRKYAAFSTGSSEWFADGQNGPLQLIEMDQRLQIGLAVDADMLQGNGVGIQGIRYSGNATSLAAAGATPTFDNILDAIYRMQANNAKPSALFCHPRTFNTLRQLKDSQGHYQLQPNPSQTADLRLFNIPIFLSNQISIAEDSDNAANHDCSWIALVDMRFVVVAQRSTVSVLLDPYTYSATDKIAVRSIARMGMGVVFANAVEVLTGVRA